MYVSEYCNFFTSVDLSDMDKNLEASNEFDTATTSAHASKLHHEERLVCKLADMHKKGLAIIYESLCLLHLVQGGYKTWGLQVKGQTMA